MKTVLRWYGGEAQKKIHDETVRRLHAACIVVVNHAKKLVSVEGTTTVVVGKTKSGKPKKKRLYGTNPSRPGEPPHKQHGELRMSIMWEVIGLVGRVGSNMKNPMYPRFLELGTKKMKARPWLRRALRECRDRIKAIFTRPMSGR